MDYPFYVSQLQDPDKNPFGTLTICLNDCSPITQNRYNKTKKGDDSNMLFFAMTDKFTLSMQSEWTTIDAFGLQDKADSAQTVLTSAAAGLGGMGGNLPNNWIGDLLKKATGISKDVANKRFKPLALSYLTWLKSNTSGFKFNLFRLAIRPEDDTTKAFVNLARMVMPAWYGSGIVVTPGGYIPPFGGQSGVNFGDIFKDLGRVLKGESEKFGRATEVINGTVTIQIGKWCTIRNLLVDDLSFTASTVCTSKGNPLYTQGSISLKPYRMWVYEDIEAIFDIKTDPVPSNKQNDCPPELFQD